MSESVEVLVPLINPNEPEATIVSLAVGNGDEVRAGDVLGEIETTKSTEEVVSPAAGFVAGLRVRPLDVVQAGDRLCWLAADRAWVPPAEEAPVAPSVPADLRITEPALALARELGVDVDALPRGPLVTAEVVRAHSPAPVVDLPAADRPGGVIVFGGGGHGRTLVDLLAVCDDAWAAAIVDDDPTVGAVLGVPHVGGGATLVALRAAGFEHAVNAVGGIGTSRARVRVFELLASAGFTCPALVHPSAVVEPSATLAEGTQVLAGAYVGSLASVGFGTIVNTRAVVSHDCVLGSLAHIAPGALLAGAVTVGDKALVGMGVTVNIGVTIGTGARIGNGAVVNEDVPAGTVVHAGSVWP